MIKPRFIEPLEKYSDLAIEPQKAIFFLKTANDEELRQIGCGLKFLFFSPLLRKASENYVDKRNGFMNDLIQTYNIQEKRYTDKKMGELLHNLLSERDELTATEFLEIAKEQGLI